MDMLLAAFVATTGLTVLSGGAAIAITLRGDTSRDEGQRAVAALLARIAVIGAGAIASLLTTCSDRRCDQTEAAIHSASNTAAMIRTATAKPGRPDGPPPYSGDFS